jgi:hypothetical protein
LFHNSHKAAEKAQALSKRLALVACERLWVKIILFQGRPEGASPKAVRANWRASLFSNSFRAPLR